MRWKKWHVGDVGGGVRGAIADEKIPEGFLLVSAPNDAVLSVRESDKCPFPESFVDPEYWDGIATKWDVFLSWKFGHTMRSDFSTAMIARAHALKTGKHTQALAI